MFNTNTNKVSEPILVKVNLQLFAGGKDDRGSTDTDQDVVDSDDSDVDYDDGEDYVDDNDTDDEPDVDEEDEDEIDLDDNEDDDQDVVDPDKKQSSQKNSLYKKMRLKAEESARKKLDAEREAVNAEKEVLKSQKQQLVEIAVERNILDSITPDKVWAKADEEGISESAARKLLEAETRSLIESEKLKVRTYYQNFERQKNDLRKEEFFSVLESEIDKICETNPNVEPKFAYEWLVGQRYKELTKGKSKQEQKGAIANEHDRMRRRTVSGTGNSRKSTGTLSNFGREAAIAMGHDPRDVAKHTAKRRNNFRV